MMAVAKRQHMIYQSFFAPFYHSNPDYGFTISLAVNFTVFHFIVRKYSTQQSSDRSVKEEIQSD
jgi:hypothetical protein